MGTISLDEFIDIKTVYQDIPTQRKSLDLGLLVGTIPQNEGSDIFTDSERIRIYSSLTEMADDGFPSTNDLYKSASLFFSQDNHPKKLAIGKIGSVIEANTANEGEILLADAKELNVNAEVGKYIYQGYALSDTAQTGYLEIIADGTTPQTGEISLTDAQAMNPDAEVGKYIDSQTSYLLSDTSVQNSELIVPDTITRNETPLEAVKACREKTEEWYMVTVCSTLTDSDISAIASYIESVRPVSVFAFTTSDSMVLTTGNSAIFNTLKASGYKRTVGLYSTDTAGNIIVACMAQWLYRMSATPLSDFLAGYINLKEVKPENVLSNSFTKTQMNVINDSYGNVFINTGSYYNVLTMGTTASGIFVDELMLGDKFEYDCQVAIADLIFNGAVIPQNDRGAIMLISCLNTVCAKYVTAGYIQAGNWTLDDVLDLEKGTYLPTGYRVQVDSFDNQPIEDRNARKCPPIYVCVKLGGKCMKFNITNYINR